MTMDAAMLVDALLSLSLLETIEEATYAAFVMLIGLGVIGYSHRRHRERQLIRNTPRAEVESMAVGAVELGGTVEAADATVPAPLTDQSCAIVQYDVEEYRWTDDGKEWRSQESGVVAEPFYLDDGTGRALVEPTADSTDYDVSDANHTQETYHDTGNQPDRIAAFVTEHTDESPSADRPRRYTQHVIPIGAETYVFGDAELVAEANPPVTPDADAADLVVTSDADTELFLVSDKAESALVEDRQYSLILGGLLGIGIFSVGLWWLLSVVGV